MPLSDMMMYNINVHTVLYTFMQHEVVATKQPFQLKAYMYALTNGDQTLYNRSLVCWFGVLPLSFRALQ